MRTAHALLVLALLPGAVAAEPRVFRGATLHPASGPPVEDADLVVDAGRIVAVGPRGTVQIPAGAVVEDVAGKVIIPGLVDTHSHIGLYALPAVPANRDGNETSSPVTPEVRALDSIWPGDPRIRMALAGGITTANVMPGSGNAVGGQTAYLKLRGDRVDDMLVRDRDGRPVLGGMKMANGENPKRANAEKAPLTRMGVAFLQRKLFVEAESHRDGDGEPDLRLDPMVEVLEGRRIVQHHTHRADDILTVLRLADEFGHRVVIQHGTEAHLVADELAERGTPVSTIVVEAPGGKLEARELDYAHPALLEAAGVRVAIHTDDMITPSRLFLRSAALAVRGGMSEAGALRAVTLEAAHMLDLGDQIGSLEPGKDADLVILSGPPFSVWTRVLETWIDGERVWDADEPADLRFQTGGYQLGDAYPAAGGAP